MEGSIIWYYEGGSSEYKGQYKKGEKEGEWVLNYENGQKDEIGKYRKGKKEGEWQSYYGNGQVQSIGSYINGKKDGEWNFYRGEDDTTLIFDENGGIKRKGNNELSVNMKVVCLMTVNHSISMSDALAYGDFSSFEVVLMRLYAAIPYESLSGFETRYLFSEFWNEYLQGETRENNCRYNFTTKTIMTGTVIRWLALDNNKKLFRRFTDTGLFSIDHKAKAYDGLNLEEWFIDVINDEDIGVFTKNGLSEFLVILRENQR